MKAKVKIKDTWKGGVHNLSKPLGKAPSKRKISEISKRRVRLQMVLFLFGQPELIDIEIDKIRRWITEGGERERLILRCLIKNDRHKKYFEDLLDPEKFIFREDLFV